MLVESRLLQGQRGAWTLGLLIVVRTVLRDVSSLGRSRLGLAVVWMIAVLKGLFAGGSRRT